MDAFGYISSIALFCYCVMFLIFLSAKRDKLVNSFLILLLAMLCWTGGSVLMRLEFWPSYVFWYHISLIGILLIPYAYNGFVGALSGRAENRIGKIYLLIILVLFAINIPTGLFLKWPDLVLKGNIHSFVYHTDYKVAAFFIPAGIMILAIFRDVMLICRKNRNMLRQFSVVISGLGILFIGNLLISLPIFKGFPIDILCGLINAGLLMYSLIRRRLFRLQMLASQSLTYVLGLLISLILFLNLSPYIEGFMEKRMQLAEHYFNLIYAIIFLCAYLIITITWKLLVKNIFIKEEMQQAEKLKQFSLAISKTLRLKDIMAETIQILDDTIKPESIYICIQENDGEAYKGYFSNRPLNDLSFELKLDNPLVTVMQNADEPQYYSDLKSTTEFRSMWESEKEQLDQLGLQACIGLKDNNVMTGIILLADKDPKHHVGYNDMQLLSSIGSIASIAIKNSRLYEKAYIEARTDEMTGLLNRKYFIEVLNEEFEKNRDGSIVLAIFNVDDFKLYNQLYGVKEGDDCLKRIADIIRNTVGENGYTARYSGKEFAVLLPKYDIFSAKNMMESISRQIYTMNAHEKDYKLKAITVSVGISAAPYAASSVKELLENVDMAVYHVKHSGKNGVQVFDRLLQNNDSTNATADHASIYKSYQGTIYALTAAIDAKDHYTFSHSNNVAYYASELAKNLGMNDDMVEVIRQAGLLHDIGKISITEPILNKTGRLTDEEFEVIKGHVEASIGIIRHLPSLDYVIPAVIGHHERYDGTGYPRRIAGEDIPATARILCIADSFDAITSRRCYKNAMGLDTAKKILLDEAGKQFDPQMVQVFVKCLDEGKIKLVQGEFTETAEGKAAVEANNAVEKSDS